MFNRLTEEALLGRGTPGERRKNCVDIPDALHKIAFPCFFLTFKQGKCLVCVRLTQKPKILSQPTVIMITKLVLVLYSLRHLYSPCQGEGGKSCGKVNYPDLRGRGLEQPGFN